MQGRRYAGMHPLKAKKAKQIPETVIFTEGCAHEAVIVLAHCESRFAVGEPTMGMHAITGETYTQLCIVGYCTAEAARAAAIEAFDAYAEGKSGILYWRIVPEIALSTRNQTYGYYMRLLISDKPRKS